MPSDDVWGTRNIPLFSPLVIRDVVENKFVPLLPTEGLMVEADLYRGVYIPGDHALASAYSKG